MIRYDKGPEEIEEAEGRGIQELIDSWKSPMIPFDRYVRRVSAAFFKSRLRLEAAAYWLSTTSAELAGLLQLATLDDESLSLMSDRIPPKTTWFALAEGDIDGIKAALLSLGQKRPNELSRDVVETAIRRYVEPSSEDKVGKLDGSVVKYMSSKAKHYGSLNPNARHALFKFGGLMDKGHKLTAKQVAFMLDLLNQMVDDGAIRRDSPDKDQEMCDAVLDALGR